MTDNPPDPSAAQKVLLTTDPLRLAISTTLAVRPSTASNLAEVLKVPVDRIRYQLKRLRDAGLVSVHAEEHRRGAVEHVYSVEALKWILGEQEIGTVPPRLRNEMVRQIVTTVFREALEAIREETFNNGKDFPVVRIPLSLDAEAWAEIHRLFTRAVDRLIRVNEEASKRLGDSQGSTVVWLGLFFERPS